VDGERHVAAALPAVAGEGHPAVLLAAVQTPRLLSGERPEVPDKVGKEVVLDDALGHVGLVDRAELACEFELGVHLVHHRPERLVRREVGAERDVGRVVGVVEAAVLVVGAEGVLADLDEVLDLVRVGHVEGRLVELAGILPDDVHVVRLVVDLRGVDPRGHDQRRVHLSAALVREERLAEVEQAVHEEHDAVLVSVTLGDVDSVRDERVRLLDGETVRMIGVAPDVLNRLDGIDCPSTVGVTRTVVSGIHRIAPPVRHPRRYRQFVADPQFGRLHFLDTVVPAAQFVVGRHRDLTPVPCLYSNHVVGRDVFRHRFDRFQHFLAVLRQ